MTSSFSVKIALIVHFNSK